MTAHLKEKKWCELSSLIHSMPESSKVGKKNLTPPWDARNISTIHYGNPEPVRVRAFPWALRTSQAPHPSTHALSPKSWLSTPSVCPALVSTQGLSP